MADVEKINKRLRDDFDYLVAAGYRVVGVFLQGSQNYHLDYAGSDIDTKAIVLPTLEDIILNHKPVSTTHIESDNSHLDIKDIRLMFDCFKKQNINFLEILFTEYYYLNPEYAAAFQPMLDNAEKIAHYNNFAAINCIAGMIFEKRAALTHRYEGLAEKIDKYGYDSKQLHHMLRCEEFLQRYIAGVPYRECLIPTEFELLTKIKADNGYYSLEEAVSLGDKITEHVKAIKDNYMQTNTPQIDKSVESIMQETLLKIFKQSFKTELL